ncbi:STAM-binding protein-like A [Armadillidium nasatum]|uniref:STAM-binding protein-like A n=1 Tax=Armadillidium nasatum TaxID=96803 RepID=A0A5N5TDK7_9CRUS|nr:STAM-binding protein-like A [Armadillidium nasatum]
MDPDSRIKALVEQGKAVVDQNIPIRRSGMEMAKMAAIYEEERNLESAFILYFRYVDLFLDKIHKHSEYASHSGIDKTACIVKAKVMLSKAELLKKTLKLRYEREFAEHVAHQKALEEIIRREKEEQELKLKKEEEERKANDKSAVNKWNDAHLSPVAEKVSRDDSLRDVAFPTQYLSENQKPNSAFVAENLVTPLPQPQAAFISPSVPSRDLKPSTSFSTPSINRDSKPQSLLSANHGLKEGKLRPIMLPHELMSRFLTLAAVNTGKNIETCGVLAGKMAANKFLITHLLIPQQVGTSDSCTTQHEEELFDQQDKYDLITLGWIHTHPTQTAFLSSVDLHTHCSYQLMMPEAVAVVCAPKFEETGYFTLTPYHGLNFIANCRESGFHPHPSEPPLFQSADHVLIDASLKIQVIDLRR